MISNTFTLNVIFPCLNKSYSFILPFIVSQSSGKSSVLESIVGKDFLPRGSGKLWHQCSWIDLIFLIFMNIGTIMVNIIICRDCYSAPTCLAAP